MGVVDATVSSGFYATEQDRDKQKPSHVLEKILGYAWTRQFLDLITRAGVGEKCWFERVCEHYNNPSLPAGDRWKWLLPEKLIDYALKRAGLDKEMMTEKLFHHRPTMRALTVTGRSIARYGLSAPQRFVAPLMVVWNITQACNLLCHHCYQNATAKPTSDELKLEEKLAAVDEMADAGVPFLAIAGGEPLFSKDIWAVLERTKQRGIHTTLATNGTMLTPKTVARLIDAGVKYVEVSIDSVVPEEHDKFRGRTGAWARSIQGIRNSVEGGMRTGLATCFTRQTVDSVDEMVELAISLGCRTFSHFNFIPVGRGKQIDEADLPPWKREWLLRKLVDHLQSGRINVISTAPQFGRSCVAYAPPDGLFACGHAGSASGRQTMILAKYVGGCGAGRCYCALQPNGDVTPCVYISGLKVGNIRRKSFAEIWDCSLFAVLSDRTDRRDHCVSCPDRAYCGGCRARSFAYFNDIRTGDPGCYRNQHLWDELSASKNSLPIWPSGLEPKASECTLHDQRETSLVPLKLEGGSGDIQH